MSFQSGMVSFLLQNPKEDLLKNVELQLTSIHVCDVIHLILSFCNCQDEEDSPSVWFMESSLPLTCSDGAVTSPRIPICYLYSDSTQALTFPSLSIDRYRGWRWWGGGWSFHHTTHQAGCSDLWFWLQPVPSTGSTWPQGQRLPVPHEYLSSLHTALNGWGLVSSNHTPNYYQPDLTLRISFSSVVGVSERAEKQIYRALRYHTLQDGQLHNTLKELLSSLRAPAKGFNSAERILLARSECMILSRFASVRKADG